MRPTDALTPEEERESFRLPPGFEIQLFASEPDIHKPMNLAFDVRGRLWTTGSREYPFPAKEGEGRDTIRILEDTDGDGRADRVSTFADDLNIPIGLLPYGDGCIVYSIPNIWRLRDRDGDGRADEREVLYGPFGFERDTHGMNNSFRRTFDGWVYACHGFNNQTSVRGSDGHVVTMQSGNTYRFRLDGSRIEQFTWGQVNPFGMTFDAFGNFYTADCHSSPIYQLVREGYYPSFGKPHDGLGFVPPVMTHGHGSTAIAGIAYCTGENFPPEYRGGLFIGNVMTSRVNLDTLVYHGSTVTAVEEPDFVRTTDPWFRPVDLQFGPDGALYIADFYNKIIGHYEVPLTHPGRDRLRGRIWRVVYRQADDARPDIGGRPARPAPDLTRADSEELLAALEDPVLTLRNLAMGELVDRVGRAAVPALARLASSERAPATARAHALWALERLGSLDAAGLERAAADVAPSVRTHAMRVLAERPRWSDAERALALATLDDPSPFVQRAAAEALGQRPSVAAIGPLLSLLRRVDRDDAYLRHTVTIALRNTVRGDGALERRFSPEDAREIARLLPSVHTPAAGAFLLRYLSEQDDEPARLSEYARHAARNAPAASVGELVRVARERFGDDVDFQLQLLDAVRRGVAQRGESLPPSASEWAAEVAGQLLRDGASRPPWENVPVPGARPSESPWVLERRRCADGRDRQRFICSLPRGEQLTGVLRSTPFAIPERLVFWCAGHVGPPDQPVVAKNFVRLRSEDTGDVLIESRPPRNDTAQRFEWDLSDWAGRQGYLEIVDGDERGAYAWLSVGRFEPELVPLSDADPARRTGRLRAAAEIATAFRLAALRPVVEGLLRDATLDRQTRARLARTALSFDPEPSLEALAAVLGDEGVPTALVDATCVAVVDRGERVDAVLVDGFASTAARTQGALAEALAGSREGAERLLALVEAGKASARLLTSAKVRERVVAAAPADAEDRMDELTADLPERSEEIEALITERVGRVRRGDAELERGHVVFRETCSPCHRLGEEGELVGPQLDGIATRGVERLVEDVLDPNRNVDVAFRTSTFFLSDGTIVLGLLRREEGATVVVADVMGKELSLAKDSIVQQIKGSLSLMPDNFGDAIPEKDFTDLVAFLVAASSTKP